VEVHDLVRELKENIGAAVVLTMAEVKTRISPRLLLALLLDF
jgi:hypothetical protein